MADKLDIKYYAPGFKIKVDGKKINSILLRSVVSISITKKIGQADNFSFKVQDQLETGVSKWLDDKLFELGKKVNVSIGYMPSSFVKAQAHIEEITPSFSDGVMSEFEISGKDKALARLAEESDYKCYTKKKDSDIVKAIAGEVGLKSKIDNTAGAAPEKKEKKGGTSYLSFIQKMVIQNKGFEFFLTDGKLVFRKSKIKAPPVKELAWGKHLLDFNPREDLSRIITGVTVRWWDEVKSKAILGKATVKDETPVGDGKTAGKIAKKVYGDIEKTITDEPVDSKNEAKNIAIAELNKANAQLVTADGKTIGMPEIEPGVMIKVLGMGDNFSGKYYVSEATHTIDSEGYYTTFSVRRNTK